MSGPLSSILKIRIPYFILTLGYSHNAYEANGKAVWRIVFMEKTKGTYFG